MGRCRWLPLSLYDDSEVTHAKVFFVGENDRRIHTRREGHIIPAPLIHRSASYSLKAVKDPFPLAGTDTIPPRCLNSSPEVSCVHRQEFKRRSLKVLMVFQMDTVDHGSSRGQ